MTGFERLINNLDLGLFEKINSQSSIGDKQSLLACQLATRELTGSYRYLEIGSYLGGSIQPHLLDPQCSRIYSIDKRPLVQPDARGVDYTYLNNSTARMIENLRQVDAAQIGKVVTIDGETAGLEPGCIADEIELCYIDGEHTDAAVVRDFEFCLAVTRKNAAILFDDADIIYNGLADCLKILRERGIAYRANILPDKIFVIEIGDFPLHRNEKVVERLLDNHQGYLYSLQSNDLYRRFVNKTPFRIYRKVMTKIKGLNRFD